MFLSDSDQALAWQIALRTMADTAIKWADSGKLANNNRVIREALDMGMVMLMARLGLPLF